MRTLVLVVLVACSKTESVATTPSATASSPPPAASVTASAIVSSSPAVADAAPSLDQELVTLVERWNEALARRDASALDDVYASHVTMYGTTYDRAQAIAAKKAALTPDYTQSIAGVLVTKGDPDKPRAIFDKSWTVRGKESHVRASLGFAKENGRWRVADETDAKTEAKLADESCLGLVHAAVLSTDDGKTYKKSPYGTMYVCGPPDCDTFQIAAIRLESDHMDRLASFDVDQKKGVVLHAGIDQKADPAIIARMKSACAREEARASGAP
jgi:ketosteroid isomerase-like protein